MLFYAPHFREEYNRKCNLLEIMNHVEFNIYFDDKII